MSSTPTSFKYTTTARALITEKATNIRQTIFRWPFDRQRRHMCVFASNASTVNQAHHQVICKRPNQHAPDVDTPSIASRLAGVALPTLLSGLLSLSALNPAAALAQDYGLPPVLLPRPTIELPPLPTEFPPLPELKLPEYRQAVLSSGLRVLLLEDHEVPLVRGVMVMPGGQFAGAAEKPGMAGLTARVQRSGGSVQHPESDLDVRLEDLAAAIEVGGGDLALSIDFQCAAEDVGEVVGLMAEVVRSPAFPEVQVALGKSQLLNVLSHRNDKGSAVARRELQRLIYGPTSIYARVTSTQDVARLERADLLQFSAKWQRPDTAIVGLVGDFNTDEMLGVLEETFGLWSPAPGQPASPPEQPVQSIPPQEHAGKVYLVDRPDLTQASVVVGEPGVAMMDPDQYALDTLTSIFNSFGGRLFDQIRSREGLAYSVAGGWQIPPDHEGLFVCGGETSRPAEFLSALLRVLGEATLQPPTDQELEQAKAETLNSFVFNFSSQYAQLQRILVQDLLGIPQEYLFDYKQRIQSVTSADVLEAAQRRLHPQLMTAVVVGDAATIRQPLLDAGFEVLPLELEAP